MLDASSFPFETFGDMLKYLRRRVRLTQNQLAGAVGYTREHLARIETNARLPDVTVIKALFVPALELEAEPELTVQFIALAQAAHRHPVSITNKTTALPSLLTSFIGRERDTDDIVKLLDRARLVTLTGTGGVGKTRLALHVATKLQHYFADGMCFVELAPVQDMTFVPNTVVSVLKLSATKPALDALIEYLGEKQYLLMLDNCEHVLAACAALAETLLRACPNLKILATSRESFGVLGATVYRVPSLSLPTISQYQIDLVSIAQAESVKLFLARAGDLKPNQMLTEHNAFAIVQLCRRLDGIPLAIELAASQVRMMSIEQIVARLDQRFEIPILGQVTTLPRHHTLRAVMDWSYALLSVPEQQFFRRLAVFVGGWTLSFIENFCYWMNEVFAVSETKYEFKQPDVLPLLASLVDKSLIMVDEREDETRYVMLESVRDYALSQLHNANEIALARLAHLKLYAVFVKQADLKLRQIDQRYWYKCLETEHDNLRAALNWAIGIRDMNMAVQLTAGLWFFWFWRGYWIEAAFHTHHVLAMTQGILSGDIYKVKLAALIFASRTGNDQLFNDLLPSIQQWATELTDQYYLAWVKIIFSFATADTDQAVLWLEAASENAKLANDAWLNGEAMFIQGDRERARGKYAEAAKLYQNSITVLKTINDYSLMAYPIGNLGRLSVAHNDDKLALLYFEEAIALCREDGNRNGIADWLLQLAALRVRQNAPLAHIALSEVIQRFYEIGNLAGVADALVQYATLALKQHKNLEDLIFAATILGAADRIFETHSRLHRLVELIGNAEFKQRTLEIRGRLNEPDFALAWAKGRVMTTSQTITLATSYWQ